MTGQPLSPPDSINGELCWAHSPGEPTGESYLKWASLSFWGPNALESLVSPESVYIAMFTQREGSHRAGLREADSHHGRGKSLALWSGQCQYSLKHPHEQLGLRDPFILPRTPVNVLHLGSENPEAK